MLTEEALHAFVQYQNFKYLVHPVLCSDIDREQHERIEVIADLNPLAWGFTLEQKIKSIVAHLHGCKDCRLIAAEKENTDNG